MARRTKRLNVTLTPAAKAMLQELSRRSGLPMNAHIETGVRAHAWKVLGAAECERILTAMYHGDLDAELSEEQAHVSPKRRK